MKSSIVIILCQPGMREYIVATKLSSLNLMGIMCLGPVGVKCWDSTLRANVGIGSALSSRVKSVIRMV